MLGYTVFRRFSTGVVIKPLPYSLDALQPVISKTLMEYHYGKHH